MEKPSSSVPKRRKKGNSKEKCAPFHRKGHIFCWKPNRRYPHPVPLEHSGNAFPKGMEPHGRCSSTGNTSCRNCTSTNRTQFESPERGICEAKRVIDHHFDTLFRGLPKELNPDRTWSNLPFNGGDDFDEQALSPPVSTGGMTEMRFQKAWSPSEDMPPMGTNKAFLTNWRTGKQAPPATDVLSRFC